MKKPETKRRNKIIGALKKEFPLGLFFHVHGNPFQEAGISDIICCVEGHFFSFEVKEPGEEATPIQIDFGRRVVRSKGTFQVIEEPEEAISFVRQWVSNQFELKSL